MIHSITTKTSSFGDLDVYHKFFEMKMGTILIIGYVMIDLPYLPTLPIPYSQKYWWELNLAVEPKIAIARILEDLNLVVQYQIAIHTILYARRKF